MNAHGSGALSSDGQLRHQLPINLVAQPAVHWVGLGGSAFGLDIKAVGLSGQGAACQPLDLKLPNLGRVLAPAADGRLMQPECVRDLLLGTEVRDDL